MTLKKNLCVFFSKIIGEEEYSKLKWHNIKEAIPDLKKRPEIFFKEISVYGLLEFLNAFHLALRMHDLEKEGLFDKYLSFHDWIALRTHYYESTSGWANMLTERYGPDLSLQKFWEHYDEYINRSFVIVQHVIFGLHTEKNYDIKIYTEGVGHVRPFEIQLVKYTEDQGFFFRYLDKLGNEIAPQEYCFNEKSSKITRMGFKNISHLSG